MSKNDYLFHEIAISSALARRKNTSYLIKDRSDPKELFAGILMIGAVIVGVGFYGDHSNSGNSNTVSNSVSGYTRHIVTSNDTNTYTSIKQEVSIDDPAVKQWNAVQPERYDVIVKTKEDHVYESKFSPTGLSYKNNSYHVAMNGYYPANEHPAQTEYVFVYKTGNKSKTLRSTWFNVGDSSTGVVHGHSEIHVSGKAIAPQDQNDSNGSGNPLPEILGGIGLLGAGGAIGLRAALKAKNNRLYSISKSLSRPAIEPPMKSTVQTKPAYKLLQERVDAANTALMNSRAVKEKTVSSSNISYMVEQINKKLGPDMTEADKGIVNANIAWLESMVTKVKNLDAEMAENDNAVVRQLQQDMENDISTAIAGFREVRELEK